MSVEESFHSTICSPLQETPRNIRRQYQFFPFFVSKQLEQHDKSENGGNSKMNDAKNLCVKENNHEDSPESFEISAPTFSGKSFFHQVQKKVVEDVLPENSCGNAQCNIVGKQKMSKSKNINEISMDLTCVANYSFRDVAVSGKPISQSKDRRRNQASSGSDINPFSSCDESDDEWTFEDESEDSSQSVDAEIDGKSELADKENKITGVTNQVLNKKLDDVISDDDERTFESEDSVQSVDEEIDEQSESGRINSTEADEENKIIGDKNQVLIKKLSEDYAVSDDDEWTFESEDSIQSVDEGINKKSEPGRINSTKADEEKKIVGDKNQVLIKKLSEDYVISDDDELTFESEDFIQNVDGDDVISEDDEWTFESEDSIQSVNEGIDKKSESGRINSTKADEENKIVGDKNQVLIKKQSEDGECTFEVDESEDSWVGEEIYRKSESGESVNAKANEVTNIFGVLNNNLNEEPDLEKNSFAQKGSLQLKIKNERTIPSVCKYNLRTRTCKDSSMDKQPDKKKIKNERNKNQKVSSPLEEIPTDKKLVTKKQRIPVVVLKRLSLNSLKHMLKDKPSGSSDSSVKKSGRINKQPATTQLVSGILTRSKTKEFLSNKSKTETRAYNLRSRK